MRDYIVHEAERQAPRGLLGLLKRKLENWRVRKDLAVLLRFNDYQLRDVGLTRAGLRALLARPTDCNLMWELERQNWAADREDLRAKAAQTSEEPAGPCFTGPVVRST